MAITDVRPRSLEEPDRPRPIGWDGQSLAEMLAA